MSDKKTHNSIIFLTTLSVYLGLVLVGGASSPVLAQAALTRNFDIQEEIEFKDDLDKKPGDEKINPTELFGFEEARNFTADSQKLRRIERLNLTGNRFDIAKWDFLSRLDFGGEVSVSKLNQQRAEWLTETFKQNFNQHQTDEEGFVVEQLHKFNLIKSENNQFFIVTNLPRASIDSLLADKDAN